MTRRVSDLADLDAAVQLYVSRFGEGPPVWEFIGREAELIREIVVAVERGERLTAADLYRPLGMTPRPPGVIL